VVIAMLHLAKANKMILKCIRIGIGATFLCVALLFLEIVPHETLKPFALKFVKEYQFERLNPNSYHKKAALSAIGLGSFFGKGVQKSDFSTQGFLPAAHTDSVFCALGEQFGLLGMYILIGLFFALGYQGLKSANNAKDLFGTLLAFGITMVVMVHCLFNIAMMLGVLPISGVPLVLLSYGGSQILVQMASLGLIQSIFIRRFRF